MELYRVWLSNSAETVVVYRPAMCPIRRRWLLSAGLAAVPIAEIFAQDRAMPIDTFASTTVLDEIWQDVARERGVPVRVRWPSPRTPVPPGGRPVVLFSHGLGGTRAGGELWGRAWQAAGLVVLHLQHPGSDLEAVRRVARSFGDQHGLRQAAGPDQLLARLGDVKFVLDNIARRQASAVGRWTEVRPNDVGLSGHSFGAHTTLGMAGQRYPSLDGVQEPRLAAFVAFSPTLPVQDDATRAYLRITRPMLCITGTRDDDVAGVGATNERRTGVFTALPAGLKAHLVLEDADHMTFAGQTGRAADVFPRHASSRALQAQHHEVVAAVTTDWWRAHLMGDKAAADRLRRPSGLAVGDLWQQG